MRSIYFIPLLAITFASCIGNQTKTELANIPIQKVSADTAVPAPEPIPKQTINYHFEYKKIWTQKDSFSGFNHQQILAAINRVDVKHLQRLDSFLVPDVYDDSLQMYFPFPQQVDYLKEVSKIIIFSYPTQSFGAYENGKLVLCGPTNMGKKASLTPTGLFFCNWKSKETRSTVDKSWILKWNFNVSNMGGVGFHQYDLPGYPASHSCMRLWAEQAEFLYYWAEQWKLNSDQQLIAQGTPVVIFGAYPFGKPRPWFVLAQNPDALNLDESQLKEIIEPYLAKIIEAQQKRKALFSDEPKPLAAVQNF